MYKNIICIKQYYGSEEHFSAQHMWHFLMLAIEATLRQRIPNEEITGLLQTEYIL